MVSVGWWLVVGSLVRLFVAPAAASKKKDAEGARAVPVSVRRGGPRGSGSLARQRPER